MGGSGACEILNRDKRENQSDRATLWTLAFKDWLINLITLTRRIGCNERPRSRRFAAVAPICRSGGNDPGATVEFTPRVLTCTTGYVATRRGKPSGVANQQNQPQHREDCISRSNTFSTFGRRRGFSLVGQKNGICYRETQALRSALFPSGLGTGFRETGFSFASFTSRFSTLRCSFGRERLGVFICLLSHARLTAGSGY